MDDLDIRYYGWSGIGLRAGPTRVGFDLPRVAARVWGDLPADGERPRPVLCITHGHPDHCGLLGYLDREGGAPHFDLVAPAEVADRFEHLWSDSPASVHRTGPNFLYERAGLRIRSFQWAHLPLVPPEPGRAASYLLKLLRHPLDLTRIAWRGRGFPLSSPTVGYALVLEEEQQQAEGTRVVNYAQGLHRLTDPRQIRSIRERFDPQILLTAVEPEDEEAVLDGVATIEPEEAYLYEAHRPWRITFELPTVDLDEFAGLVAKRAEVEARALE